MSKEYEKLKIFLCYAKEDSVAAREIYNELRSEGWTDVWFDEEKLLPGQRWDIEIRRAVKQSHIVIILLSNSSVQKSGYVQKELRYILDVSEEKPEDVIFVIVVRIDDCPVPERLQSWQWVNYFPRQNKVQTYKRLIESLKLSAARLEIPTNQFNKIPNTPDSIQFVIKHLFGRTSQLDRFTNLLDHITNGRAISSNILEWYGSPGIGKSTLISILANQAEEKLAYHVVINFQRSSREKNDTYLHDPITLIEEIVSDLKYQVVLDTYEFDTFLKRYKDTSLPHEGVVSAYSTMDQDERLHHRPTWLTELRNVIVAFIKLINTLPSQKTTDRVSPVILFFDDTEYADIELIDWIEEWIINPLIQIKHCVVVWTARRPWRWKRPEIRRRLTSEMLRGFDPSEVREQIQFSGLKTNLAKVLFKHVYSLTGGHPYANQIVINELITFANQGVEVTSSNFQDFEPKLLIELFDKFINGYAFRELESKYLRIACKFISLVRLFDSTMLRTILQACGDDLFSAWNQDDFGDLLLKLKKTQLLVWEKGYALDPELRYIIQNYFILNEPDKFIQANQAALQVYESWLERPVDNRGLFVLEELYHHAALSHVGKFVDINVILGKRLADYPNWIRDEHALDNALERLETDIANDKDLGQFNVSTYELVQQVRVFRESKYSS